MYVYLNRFYEITTVIPHGEILRQGGDLNLYVCFDKELTGKSLEAFVETKDGIINKFCEYQKRKTFKKNKDSEITYELVDGKDYHIYHTKFFASDVTHYSGKIILNFKIISKNEEENPITTAATALYVEKTIGYEIPNDNISKNEYLKLKELINQLDAKKTEINDTVLRKELTSEFVANDKDRLFIDDKGNIFSVVVVNNELKPIIINLSLEETNKLLEENYQKKLTLDFEPMKNSENFVRSGGIYDAIDLIPYVEVTKKTDGSLNSVIIDDEEVNLSTTKFDVGYGIENGKVILKSITLNGDTYYIKEYKEHDPITVDTTISSDSTNPVQNKALYKALEKKVDKINGKGLSTYDFDDAAKNKLNSLDKISQNHDKDVKNISGRITLLNEKIVIIEELIKKNGIGQDQEVYEIIQEIRELLNEKVDKDGNKVLSDNNYTNEEKNKLSNLKNYDDTLLKQKISSIEKILASNDDDLDTLQEIVNILKSDESGLDAIIQRLNNKIDKDGDKMLSDNNYTTIEKNKLNNLPTYSELTNLLSDKVSKDGNKMLSDNNFTNEYKNTLDNLNQIIDEKLNTQISTILTVNLNVED